MNPEIHAGVIGMGKMGILHSGILNSMEDVRVTAIADNQTFLLKTINALLPKITTYTDYNGMIEQENLDVIFITTPTSLHTRIAQECIKNNIPFFVEKPLGTSVADCQSLLQSMNKNPTINMVGYCKRFQHTFHKAKEIIDKNVLGELVYFNATTYVSQIFSKGVRWRYDKKTSGGGVLNTFSVHAIDLLLWYFGEILSLQGNIKNYYSQEVEDFAHCYLKFKQGPEGFFDTTWSVRNYRMPEIKIELHAENGMLIVTDDYLKTYSDKDEKWTVLYKQDLDKGVFFDLGGPEYSLEDEHMIQAIKQRKGTNVDIIEGFKVQKAVEGIYKSAKNNCTIMGEEL